MNDYPHKETFSVAASNTSDRMGRIMNDRTLDGIQNVTKKIVSVVTGVGVFSIELSLLGKATPFHGAARVTAALCKAGKLVGIPTMTGGLAAMVGSSMFVGYEAGEAVDYIFNQLRTQRNVVIPC